MSSARKAIVPTLSAATWSYKITNGLNALTLYGDEHLGGSAGSIRLY